MRLEKCSLVFIMAILFSSNFICAKLTKPQYNDDADGVDDDDNFDDGIGFEAGDENANKPQHQPDESIAGKPESHASDGSSVKMRDMKNSGLKLKIPLDRLHEYHLELAVIGVSVALLVFFYVGFYINTIISQKWVDQYKPIIESYFDFCGSIDTKSTKIILVGDSKYVFWCTGSKFCKGALIELDLLPRHSLIDIIYKFVLRRPINDTLKITTFLNNDADIPIMVMGNRETITKDVVLNAHRGFCKESNTDILFSNKKTVPKKFCAFSELNEFYEAIAKRSFGQLFRKYGSFVDSVLFTDLKYNEFEKEFTLLEYEGVEKDQVLVSKTVTIGLRFGNNYFKSELCSSGVDLPGFFEIWASSLTQLAASNNFPISKEGKLKLSKARSGIVAKLQRKSHQLRVEKAMQRKDMKLREENEKIMSTPDPVLQMKLQAKKDKRVQRSAKKKMSKSIKIVS